LRSNSRLKNPRRRHARIPGSTGVRGRLARALGVSLVCWGLMVAVGLAEDIDTLGIVVLPVVVHSAESPEYLREGLADMLASRLEQVSQFRVIRVDDSAKATTSLGAAIKMARKLEADFVLFGSFTQFGKGASLDMQCAAAAEAATEKPLREIFVHSGSIGEVIPDLDELVGKVSRFAIPGFEDVAAVSTGPTAGAGVGRRVVDDLRKRIEAVESSLVHVSAELETLKGDTAGE
jgi:TolB-like protein